MQNPDFLPLIISISVGVFTIVASMVALMLWVRGEANADRRAIQATLDAIKDEMKDFHVRLIEIEKERIRLILKQ
jgi:hypothetical protein